MSRPPQRSPNQPDRWRIVWVTTIMAPRVTRRGVTAKYLSASCSGSVPSRGQHGSRSSAAPARATGAHRSRPPLWLTAYCFRPVPLPPGFDAEHPVPASSFAAASNALSFFSSSARALDCFGAFSFLVAAPLSASGEVCVVVGTVMRNRKSTGQVVHFLMFGSLRTLLSLVL